MAWWRTGGWARAVAGLALAGCVGAGTAVLPPAAQILAERRAADDPVALAALRLPAALTPARIEDALAQALAAEDAELARSLIELAQSGGVAVPRAQAEALAALEADAARRAVSDFAYGFLAGTPGGGAALAGSVTADMVGYGDLRDLWHEGRRIAAGAEPDPVTISLGVAGIALTGAVWTSFGAALPARGGLTALKAAERSGALSVPMRASIARLGREAVDVDQAGRALAASRRFDVRGTQAALRASVRPAGVASLRALAADTATLGVRTGPRGLAQALALADDARDLRRAARLAEAHGPRTRGILALMGRSALVFGSVTFWALGTVFGALVWLLAAAMLAGRLARLLARGLLRLPRACVAVATTTRPLR